MGQLPDIYTGVAFNAEPFDTSAVPVWVDLSGRYEGTSSASRGRSQYELAQSQTGTADITMYDQDEALNPQNAGSPYSPLVVPYRAFLWRVMYPLGGTGNVIAASASGADGSFESYTTLAQMQAFFSFLYGAASSPVTFALSSGSAWQGTKAASVQLNTSSSNVVGGQFSVPLIPGRTYTAQAHINQTVAAKFQLAIGNMTIAVDSFNRTTVNGWGTPGAGLNFGPAWTSTGTAANFLTAAGVAFHSASVVNTRLTSTTGANVQDSSSWVTVSPSVLAIGAPIGVTMYARYTTVNDTYQAALSFGTGGGVTAVVNKIVAGVSTNLGTVVLPDLYAAGDQYRMRLDVTGAVVGFKAWRVSPSVTEPPQWTIQVTDNAISLPGQVGVSTLLNAGNTNTLPVSISWTDYRCLGSVVDTVNGVTTTSGSYQLLKQTFTATQPFHTIQLESQATPAANITVLIDGLQVEPGASANAFTTVGPIIRSPWTRGFVERWPGQWDADSMGFLGILSAPVVGPSAILSSAFLSTEYANAVLAKQPRYYYPLNEPSNAIQFADKSGFGGPILSFRNNSDGFAPAITVGSTMGIPGDPGGVGVKMTTNISSNGGTSIQSGPAPGSVPITSVGQASSSSWGVTLSCWAINDSQAPAIGFYGSYIYLGAPLVSGFTSPSNITLGLGDGFGNGAGLSVIFQGTGTYIHDVAPLIDGKPHHYVGTFTMTSTTFTTSMYVDGVQVVTSSGNPATIWTLPFDSRVNWIELMGVSDPYDQIANFPGTMAHAAIWNRALTQAEVIDLYSAGQGYPNENSGSRVARYLQLVGYTNPNFGIADIQQGSTFMGVSTLAANTSALSAIQNVQDTEFGNFYEAQEGVAFRGRQARYLTVAPSYILGENASGGEYPYLGTPVYDLDPTYTYTSAVITRSGGIVASAIDTTGKSQLRYGNGRQFTRTINNNSDNEAQDAATYVVANGKDARVRVEAITLDPGTTRGLSATSDGTMWTMVLTLEPGTRVTAKRRAKAANSGAGIVLSSDYFIEGLTPGNIVIEQGTYQIQVLMSPVPPVSAGGQPWILENATYGVLDSTTILGF